MYWMIAVLVLVFGAALLARFPGARTSRRRRAGRSGPIFPRVPPLKPGEKYDTTVKLVTLPNVPLAELWRQRLREYEIEAFYKGGSPLAGAYGTALDQALPAELWVGEHDAERARQLLRELE
jgi:hypothetical protein